MPPGAVQGGQTSDGHPLYVAMIENEQVTANYDPRKNCAEYELDGYHCAGVFSLLILFKGLRYSIIDQVKYYAS